MKKETKYLLRGLALAVAIGSSVFFDNGCNRVYAGCPNAARTGQTAKHENSKGSREEKGKKI